jgi:hypothetical protein
MTLRYTRPMTQTEDEARWTKEAIRIQLETDPDALDVVAQALIDHGDVRLLARATAKAVQERHDARRR